MAWAEGAMRRGVDDEIVAHLVPGELFDRWTAPTILCL